jgi:hypothetical protein
MINLSAPDTVCIALSEPYLRMVEFELKELAPATRARLRIFRAPGLPGLAPELKALTMPYDHRLNGRDSKWVGTASTFSVRAAHHFITCLSPRSPNGTADEHASLVEAALAEWRPPRKRPAREKATDAAIRKSIRRLFRQGITARTAQLRHLRTKLSVQCEQARFDRLHKEVVDA